MVNVISSVPSEYRLIKRGDETVLQGGFTMETGEVEWRDLPTLSNTVKDQLEESPTKDQIAQVILLHGTSEQRKEALEYIGIPITKNELTSNRGNRFLFIGYDRDRYVVAQTLMRPSLLSVWMLRDSDRDVELLTVDECDYELKYTLISQ